LQGALRQGREKRIGGTGAAANRSAASMKEANLDARLLRDCRQPDLRLAQIPVAGQDASVLVAVAVPDRDLLQGSRRFIAFLDVAERSFHGRMCQKLREDVRARFQIVNCFKEW